MRTFTALLAAVALAAPVFANSDVAWVPNDAKRCDRSNGHTSGCPKTVRIAARERVEIQVGGKRQLRVEKDKATVTGACGGLWPGSTRSPACMHAAAQLA
jgi:hypothetical protein